MGNLQPDAPGGRMRLQQKKHDLPANGLTDE
jgi:hypothetical protein